MDEDGEHASDDDGFINVSNESPDYHVVIKSSRIVFPQTSIHAAAVAVQRMSLTKENTFPHTVFSIDVMSSKDGKIICEVEKRYKDFLALHRTLRSKFPEVDGLQFPKRKTPFSTFAKSNTEDRKTFFQGYLNALLRLKPRPIDVLIFLNLTKLETIEEDGSISSSTTANVGAAAKPKLSLSKAKQFGTSLDDFELLCVLGKGAFGKVFLVRERHLDQLFAMKVLKKKLVVERKQVQHTLTERDLMGSIHHPFIVELKFSFQTKHNLFMVSEFCAGGELFFHLRRMKGFPESTIKFYAAEVILALEHLHNKHIVYRDLKPENILLDDIGHIKLADFGLAKQHVDLRGGAKTYCGTPEYLSPEMIKIAADSRSEYGFEVDYWSVGNLMYEMYYGRAPFFDKNPKIMLDKILYHDLTFPEPAPSTAFQDIVKGLLEREPKLRIGCREGGISEIKNHPFFSKLDWIALYNRRVEPPFRTELKNSLTRNFDAKYTELVPSLSISTASTETSATSEKTHIHSNHTGQRNHVAMLSQYIYSIISRALTPPVTEARNEEEVLEDLFKDFAFTSTTPAEAAASSISLLNGDSKTAAATYAAAEHMRDSISVHESDFENLWEVNDEDLEIV